MDICKTDWVDSYIFKRAMKDETIRRGLEYEGESVEDSYDESNGSEHDC